MDNNLLRLPTRRGANCWAAILLVGCLLLPTAASAAQVAVIEAGSAHTVVVKSDGSLWAWSCARHNKPAVCVRRRSAFQKHGI